MIPATLSPGAHPFSCSFSPVSRDDCRGACKAFLLRQAGQPPELGRHTVRPSVRWLLVLILALLLFSGCYPKVEVRKELSPVPGKRAERLARAFSPSAQGLSSWQDYRPALERSLEYVSSRPQEGTAVRVYNREITWGRLQATLKRLLHLLPRLENRPELLRKHFTWLELRPGPLYTGYFEPALEGSLKPRPGYPYPIYGRPRDLKVAELGDFHPRWEKEKLIYRLEGERIVPYHSRRAIEESVSLRDKAPIVAWAKDLLDLFFLQIQGSGKLILPDGEARHIGYAGKNGRRYVSLGRVMVEKGYLELEEVSLQRIETYLQENPDLLPEILYSNPSYVFFSLQEDGPFGAMGRKLTPWVSLAVDPGVVPLGSLLAFSLPLPGQDSGDTLQLSGLGLAQDVGGAVKGHHVDLFCGSGRRARYMAGHLKHRGALYVLLVREEGAS